MDHPGVVVAAVVAFVGTNIDDFGALLLLAIGARSDRLTWARIIGGQYVGFGLLLVAALLGAALFSLVNVGLVDLLGVVPIVLGVRGLVSLLRDRAPGGEPRAVFDSVCQVAVLTIANGGDNLSVYIPLYRELTFGATAVTTVVFLILLGALCLLALGVGRYARLIPGTVRVCRWVTPFVYIAIGGTLLLQLAAGTPAV